MAILTRNCIADYLNVGTRGNPIWALCGMGFNSLDESPNAQVESKVYIHQKEATPSITRYEPSFSFDTDVWNDQEAVMKIYEIARDRKVGSDAIVQYLRTDFLCEEDGTPITTTVKARVFDVAVEVSDIQGNGGETLTMSGNFNQVGAYTDGVFDLTTRTWTDGGTIAAKTLGSLTLTVAEGTTSGNVKVTVTPDKSQNNYYLYKTGAGAITLPAYNDYISSGWTSWDGYDEITLASGSYLVLVEVSGSNLAKSGGTVQYGSTD